MRWRIRCASCRRTLRVPFGVAHFHRCVPEAPTSDLYHSLEARREAIFGRMLERATTARRQAAHRPGATAQRVYDLIDAGQTTARVAEEIGVSAAAVRYHLRRRTS